MNFYSFIYSQTIQLYSLKWRAFKLYSIIMLRVQIDRLCN